MSTDYNETVIFKGKGVCYESVRSILMYGVIVWGYNINTNMKIGETNQTVTYTFITDPLTLKITFGIWYLAEVQ